MRWNQHKERRGVILLVVLSLLTLFAIVGISFVLYADAEAASARIARQAETQQRADVDPQQALAFFLGQLIYDVPDATGYGSGLRGHSLARNMYGYNSTYNYTNNTNLNVNAFNGVGRLQTDGNNWPYMNPYNYPDNQLVNYTWFQGDKFARAPEWYTSGVQNNPNPAGGSGAYYVGCNAPYTYPDLNNFFLAAVRSDGTVLTPSFHRPWLFNPGKAFNDMSNSNWANAVGKYLTLRPRPQEHPGFPLPDDAFGDVKNLVGAPGGNDSIWIDLGAPVMTAPDGTMYKMMFAPLIMDLDNRINVAAAGNIVGSGNTSLSNQGWFPSEINLTPLWSNSTVPNGPTEWLKLFLGNSNSNGTSYIGKYGPDKPVPIATGPLFPASSVPRVYAQTDPDGRNEKAGNVATGAIQLPGTNATTALPTTCFPYFPPGYGSGSAAERITLDSNNNIIYRHPAAYAVNRTPLFTTTLVNDLTPTKSILNNDFVFRPSEMEAFLRPNSTGLEPVDSGTSALISNMLRLCPQTLGGPTSQDSTAFQRRNWITTLSADVTVPGLSPWIYNPADASTLYTVNATTPSLPPFGNPASFPTFTQIQAPPSGSDFTAGRALPAALGRIDLNRPLTPYPHMLSSPNNFPLGSTDNQPHSTMTNTPNDNFNAASTNYDTATIKLQFSTATLARQQFALDIYTRLLAVAGVAPIPPGSVANPNAQQLAPRRWLAQLAVNIVDYIDADEISTPFNFYNTANASDSGMPTVGTTSSNTQVTATGANTIPNFPVGNPNMPMYWVFGTELPRVLINEVLGEYKLPAAGASPPTFNVNLWVELFNPMPTSASVTNTQTANGSAIQTQDALPVPLWIPGPNGGITTGEQAYNPYQIVIADNNTTNANGQGLWYDTTGLNNNVLGTPRYNYFVHPTAPPFTNAGCKFGAGTGETNLGYAGTIAAPANPTAKPPQGYPLFPSAGNWGLYGGLPTAQPGQTSYILVGPQANDIAGDIAGTSPLVSSPNMTYQVSYNAGAWSVTLPGNPTPIPITDNTTGVSVLLQRLANPHLQPNPFQADGTLAIPGTPPNPYITVDYVSGVPLNGYNSNGTQPVPQPNNSPATPASCGKLQPYAANLTLTNNQVDTTSSQYVLQTGHHTFGSPNSTQANPFTWLVHLDRNVISPMELLHVSGFHPHELTQRFILGPKANANGSFPPISQPYNYTHAALVPAGSTYFQHYVPWFDQTRRLYRLFEFLEAYNGASGIPSVNGRVPGKININTLWDVPTSSVPNPPMYQAICDPPQAANADNPNFTATNVTSVFYNASTNPPSGLLGFRTPGLASATLSASDVPYVGMAAGLTGINNTLLSTTVAATQPTTPGQGPALQLPNAAANNPQIAHPYLQNELLTKIYSRFTNRSNVFAVFLTVGFFQVMTNSNGSIITVDGQPNSPPQLGAEIGLSEGRQVRHRMFALVDRSQLAVFATTTLNDVQAPSSPAPAESAWQPTVSPPAPGLTLNPTNSVTQTYQTVTGATWLTTPGTQLVIEPGTSNEETVMVTSVAGGNGNPISLMANFYFKHPNQSVTGNPDEPPYVVIQRGNPGPWPAYDPRKDPLVVPYFSIID